jgi:hypothetical protein
MMMAITNEYRQVKVHRKKKLNQDNVGKENKNFFNDLNYFFCLLIDVHSTTTRHNGSIGTILVLTIDDSSYIDITLFDAQKQEFYTKMNLIGEITFEDHRYDLFIRKHVFIQMFLYKKYLEKGCSIYIF